MNFVNRNVGAQGSVAIADADAGAASPQKRNWGIAYRTIEPLAIAADALVILATNILSGLVYHHLTQGSHGDILQYAGSASAVAVLFVILAKNRDLYKPSKLLSFRSQIHNVALIWLGAFLFCASVVFALKIGKEFSRGVIVIFAASGFFALCSLRAFWRLFISYGLAENKFAGRRAVLISGPASSADFDPRTHLARHGLRVERHFVLPINEPDLQRSKEVISKAAAYVRGSDIEEVFVAAELDRWAELNHLMSGLRVLPLPVNLIPVGASSEILKLPFRTIGDSISIELQRGPLTRLERAIKRIFDIICAVTGLIMMLPLLLITAVVIKLDSPGPVLFRQRRCGFNGKQFKIFKFRTMIVCEDGCSIVQARPGDNRLTRVGKWLRRTSVDELPQLLNVLGGSMSIVGPRPHALAHDDEFYKIIDNYAFRHHVKPGMTGWAQVNGFRGQTPTTADMEQRVKLDMWYIDNWNMGIDILIIFRTAFEVLRGKNAY